MCLIIQVFEKNLFFLKTQSFILDFFVLMCMPFKKWKVQIKQLELIGIKKLVNRPIYFLAM